MKHRHLYSDQRVGVAATFPLRKQELLNLNWLHAQITTSFEEPEVTQLMLQGCMVTHSKNKRIKDGIGRSEPVGLKKADPPGEKKFVG